jgi:hypothetical protein
MAAKHLVYSVTVEDVMTWFATKREARAFERRHIDSGIECDPVNGYTKAELVAHLNEIEDVSSSNKQP